MNMTLEQAIRILHPVGEDECVTDDEFFEDLDQVYPALLLACEVMQREVEMWKGCEVCSGGNEWFNDLAKHEEFNFCPMCGKPLNNGKVDGDE